MNRIVEVLPGKDYGTMEGPAELENFLNAYGQGTLMSSLTALSKVYERRERLHVEDRDTLHLMENG